jgi:predicted DNA-binding protein (MmcQ/YjbR family)
LRQKEKRNHNWFIHLATKTHLMDVEQLRKFCLSLPGVTEDIKWGHDLCFSIGSRMFCVTSMEAPVKTSFKVKDEEFDEITAKDGFIPAPYMARAKWILVEKRSALSKKEWEHFITQSYQLVASKLTKKLRLELGIEK